MRTNIIKYGTISGSLMVLVFLGFYLIFDPDFSNPDYYTIGEIVGYTTMIASLALIFLGIKNYRDKELKGKINFGKAFKLGIGITFIASLLFGFYTFILYGIIDPDLTENMFTQMTQGIESSNLSESEKLERLNQMKTEKEMFASPAALSAIMFFTVMILGGIISLISSIILKKGDKK